MQPPPVNSSGPSPLRGAEAAPRKGAPSEDSDFRKTLQKYLDQVNELQQQADRSVLDLAEGRTENLHQVVAAVSEADLSFRLMMQVRNKLLEAYKEIMRMQV